MGSQIAWPTLSSNILAISILQIKSIEKIQGERLLFDVICFLNLSTKLIYFPLCGSTHFLDVGVTGASITSAKAIFFMSHSHMKIITESK